MRGAAVGVFSSLQFLGAFFGAVAGGFLYGHWGTMGTVILCAMLLVIWLAVIAGMKVPAALSTRVYALADLDRREADGLAARLRALPGVHEARVAAQERRAYLRVDSAGFDEQNVRRHIAGET